MNFVIIETERLILKGLSPADMTYIFRNLSGPDIMKTLGHRSEADYLKEENKFINGYSAYNRSFLLFLLTDKKADQIIGRCGIHNWNTDHKRAEIGYIIEDENSKNKGFMSEALAAVIKYAFEDLNLHRLEALVGSRNIPSLRLMEKHTFQKEGLMREHYFTNGIFEDSVVFSKLVSEYNQLNR